MKNKVIEINQKPATYGEIIKDVLNNPGQQGFTLSDIEIRLAIRAKMDDRELKFTDKEKEVVKAAVKNMRWLYVEQSIIDFCKEIETL